MKKIIYLLVFSFLIPFNSIGNNEDVFLKSKVLIEQKKYHEAIQLLNKFVEVAKPEQKKELIIDLAFCYYHNNQKRLAVKTIYTGIKLGVVKEQDFVYNPLLNTKFGDYILKEVYDSF